MEHPDEVSMIALKRYGGDLHFRAQVDNVITLLEREANNSMPYSERAFAAFVVSATLELKERGFLD